MIKEFSGLHAVITGAWHARRSPSEWSASVLDWNRHANQSPRKLSIILCELLLNQISVGPAPSPLLVSYLQYGMVTRLIHPIDFFTRMHSVISPSRAAQLNSFLTLLVAPFIQHIRAFDEVTGDEICDGPWRNEYAKKYADIATELARAYVLISTLLADGVEYGMSKDTKPIKSDSSNPTSPLTALFATPTSPPPQSVPGSSTSKVETKGVVAANVQLCTDILTEILIAPRTKAFVLMARHTHPDLWNNLTGLLRKITAGNSVARLTVAFIGLTKPYSVSLPWLSRSDPEGLGLPWMSVMLAVEFETKGKVMYSSEDAFARFEMMRSVRGYSHLDFYCELWSAALRTLQRTEYLTEEWINCKDFLLVKIPLLLCKWKHVLQQDSSPISLPHAASFTTSSPSPPSSSSLLLSPSGIPSTPPSTSINAACNDVEHSIFFVSQYSQLVGKQIKDGHTFDPLEAIARSCVVRGLATVENLKFLIPTINITLPPPSATSITIAALLSGEIPHTEEDVLALKRVISPELKLEESTAQVMSSICTILSNNTDIQEHMVMLVLYVLDKDSSLDLALVLNLIAQINDVLTVIKAHGKMPNMMAYLVQYCDEYGYSPPENYTQHHKFGTAFCLLAKTMEFHNLRSHAYNQIVLHDMLRSIASRKMGNFVTPTSSNTLHPRAHNVQETSFPFWEWYRNFLYMYLRYLFRSRHSVHTPYCTTHVVEADGTAKHKQDPLQILAHKVLETLRGNNPKEKLKALLATCTGWQLMQSIPYLCCTLYQGCVLGLSVDTLVRLLVPFAEEVPHCMSEIAFWLVDELARGTRHIDEAKFVVPLPLTILSAILEIPLPAIVFDTMKLILGPTLHSLRSRHAVVDAVIAKLAWQQPNDAFFVESVHFAKFVADVFQRVLDVAYPSSALLQATFNSMFLLFSKLGAAHFVDLICKEFMNVMITQTGNGHSTVHAMRTAELCGAIIGVCGSSMALRLLYTEKVPIFLHWIKNQFQSELLAYFCMLSGLFCGIFHVSAFVSSMEDCFGLETSFGMQHISQIISDLIEQQQRQITPVFTFTTTFLTLLLSLPHSKLISFGKGMAHQIGLKLKQLGRADLVVSLLDLSDAGDRAFAAHLLTSVVL